MLVTQDNLKTKIIKNKNINLIELKKIIKLKKSEWKYNYSSQIKWIKSFLKPNDVHFLLIKNNKLIGYNLLRKRIIFDNVKHTHKNDFFYFDTFIIDKKYRKKGYARYFINKINNFILKDKKLGLLLCKKIHINFYKKYKWKKVIKKKFIFLDKKTRLNIMVINFNKNKFRNNYSIKLN